MALAPRIPSSTVPHRWWDPRHYSGIPTDAGRLRSELRTDLAGLPGVGGDLVATVVLCASEMFANTLGSGLHPGPWPRPGPGPDLAPGPDPGSGSGSIRFGRNGNRVIRTMALHEEPVGGPVLCLALIGKGVQDSTVRLPYQASAEDWREVSRGQGLLLIDHFATCWGTRRGAPPDEGPGTVIWAEFALRSRTENTKGAESTGAPKAWRAQWC